VAGRIESYAEFWPFYLSQHSHPANRALHLAGTGAGIALLAAGLAIQDWRPIVAAAVAGYGFAWAGHFLVERNRPATFTYPLWSLLSDLRLFGLFVTGRLKAELERQGFR
jgi:hypothetical protein